MPLPSPRRLAAPGEGHETSTQTGFCVHTVRMRSVARSFKPLLWPAARCPSPEDLRPAAGQGRHRTGLCIAAVGNRVLKACDFPLAALDFRGRALYLYSAKTFWWIAFFFAGFALPVARHVDTARLGWHTMPDITLVHVCTCPRPAFTFSLRALPEAHARGGEAEQTRAWKLFLLVTRLSFSARARRAPSDARRCPNECKTSGAGMPCSQQHAMLPTSVALHPRPMPTMMRRTSDAGRSADGGGFGPGHRRHLRSTVRSGPAPTRTAHRHARKCA